MLVALLCRSWPHLESFNTFVEFAYYKVTELVLNYFLMLALLIESPYLHRLQRLSLGQVLRFLSNLVAQVLKKHHLLLLKLSLSLHDFNLDLALSHFKFFLYLWVDIIIREDIVRLVAVGWLITKHHVAIVGQLAKASSSMIAATSVWKIKI